MQTNAFKTFSYEQNKFLHFLDTLAMQAEQIDKNRKVAIQALHDTSNEGTQEKAKYKMELDNYELIASQIIFKQNNRFLAELLLTKTIDNFQTFITELLTLVYRKFPRMIESSEKITFEEVLEQNEIGNLIHLIVEKKVMELSYKGLGDLNSYLKKKLDFSLITNDSDLRFLFLKYQERNLLVHNYGTINFRFKKLTNSEARIGDKLELELRDSFDFSDFAFRTAKEINDRAIEKWSLIN